MAKKVTANGKTFTFDDNVTNDEIASAVDEYFSSKKKVETAPSASTSTVSPTTAPSVSAGGTSGLETTPSVSQGIPSLPGRVNPQTLAPINKPIQQVPEPAVATQQKPIAQTPAGEYKPELYTVDPNKANIGKNDLGENLTVGQKDLGTINTYSGQSLGGQTTGFTQGVIANKEEAKDLKGKSDYFNKVYVPIAKQKGLELNSDEATMDFYLNYLKDTNPAEYKYNLDKFNSLREAIEEGKNTKNYAGDTKEDQLDLERFEAELITKGTRLKTEAYSGFKRETKATIENYYQDKVDNFSKLSSDGDKKISEVNSVIDELDKFPKNENGEIITDATNRKQVEQLIEKQQKLIGEIETIQGGIKELQQDKDFNDAYSLMQDADARQEEVSKRYYDLATNNPEAFKNLPEYKALLERKAAAKKKKDYQENVLGVTSFGINEGVSQAVTNFTAKLAYIPKALGADGYGFTDQMYDAVSQNIQDFNDEYLTTPTEMDKPIIGDKMSYKYLPGKLAGMATDMALMILTTKGIGGAAGSLPMVSEGVASSIGQVASGYAMSAQGYYEEAKASGMDESESRSIASQVALIDGLLELVSPNEKLISPFKLKDDFAQYGKALANGATKKKALAETTKRIIEKNIPENIQEQLQSLNAHVMFTSNELSKANESARQSYGQEAAETFLMTTLLTTMLSSPQTVTTRNRYDNEALYMAAFAPDKMMSTMSKNLERGLITQEQFDKLSQKIATASEALKKMGDVPQEKKIKALPAMVEKMEEEAKKKEVDAQFQAPIDEKIKTKEEEIKQILNAPSEAELLDENIAYLQELDKEGLIDDSQKAELKDLLTQKEKTNVQEEKSQAEVLTEPVEETAPYVVDATEQRQPVESIEEVSGSTIASDLVDTRAEYRGEIGIVRQDEGGKLTFETDDKIFELDGNEQMNEFVPQELSLIDGKFELDGQNYEFVSVNENKNGDIVSVTLRNEQGKQITKRNPELANQLDRMNKVNSVEQSIDSGYTTVEEVSSSIDKQIEKDFGGTALKVIDSMPDEVSDTFDLMASGTSDLDPDKTQEMVLMSSEWADNAKQQIQDSEAPIAEKQEATKLIDKFQKELNKYYEKLEKQRKGKANALVKSEPKRSVVSSREETRKQEPKAEVKPIEKQKEAAKETPKVEAKSQEKTVIKKEEAKPEVKTVELEPRIPGGLPRKMEFKDGEWKLLSGDEYTRVAPAVQQQAQDAFDGVKTEVKKEEVKPVVTETAVPEVTAPKVKAEAIVEAKKETKGTSQSNKQTVAKPTKVEKVAEEKPIESNKKNDLIDQEEEADNAKKEDKETLDKLDKDIEALKQTKEKGLVEKKLQGALYRAYKAKEEGKIKKTTYTAFRNTLEEVAGPKVDVNKSKAKMHLALIKDKVKERLLGEGFRNVAMSAPGINPKVVSDLIDAAFKIAEKSIDVGFTLKEAVDKAKRLIKANPNYKAAIRNKQIDEKEFDSKIDEAINEETEALKKAYEEKTKAEPKTSKEQSKAEEDILTGKEKVKTIYDRQSQTGKMQKVVDKISILNKTYKEVSKEKTKEYIDKVIMAYESNDAIMDLANELMSKKFPVNEKIRLELESAVANRLSEMALNESLSDVEKEALESKSAELFARRANELNVAATQTNMSSLSADLIGGNPKLLEKNISDKIKEVREKGMSEQKKSEMNNQANQVYDEANVDPEFYAKVKEQAKKEVVDEMAKKIFGSEEQVKKVSEAIDSIFVDLSEC